MKEFIDKLISRLGKESDEWLERFMADSKKGHCNDYADGSNDAFNEAISIVNELAEEYQNDNLSQLSNKYWKCLIKFGVDITEKWETATQNAVALEQAYMRGRQDEINRFAEWQEEHNNGWIPCSERLPEDDSMCLVTVEYSSGRIEVNYGWFDRVGVSWYVGMHEFRTTNVHAWMPLPAPYTEGE